MTRTRVSFAAQTTSGIPPRKYITQSTRKRRQLDKAQRIKIVKRSMHPFHALTMTLPVVAPVTSGAPSSPLPTYGPS